MSSITQCTSCGRALRVPDDKGSLRVTCPSCKAEFDWPASSASTGARARTQSASSESSTDVVDELRQTMIDTVASSHGWSQDCDNTATAYAKLAITLGREVSEVRDEIISCGLSRKGANQIVRGALAQPTPASEPWSLKHTTRLRATYISLYFVHIGLAIWGFLGVQPLVILLSIAALVAFIVVFGIVARRVLNYSVAALIATVVLLCFVPFWGLIVLAINDHRVLNTIRDMAE